jgi:hypothetical protein
MVGLETPHTRAMVEKFTSSVSDQRLRRHLLFEIVGDVGLQESLGTIGQVDPRKVSVVEGAPGRVVTRFREIRQLLLPGSSSIASGAASGYLAARTA